MINFQISQYVIKFKFQFSVFEGYEGYGHLMLDEQFELYVTLVS